MKKVTIFLITIYLILSVVVTVCLLSYNKYNAVDLLDKIIVTSKKINEKGNKLIIVNKDNKYEVGDVIYYYNPYSSNLSVARSKITLIEPVNDTEKTIMIDEDKYLSSEYVIGSSATEVSILGSIFDVLTSRIGYLLLIIFQVFLLLLYSIVKIIKISRVKHNEK